MSYRDDVILNLSCFNPSVRQPDCSAGAAARGFATISQASVKVAAPASAVTGQKKSWGIGARHREQLGAQKPKTGAAEVVSRPSTGEFMCPVVSVQF